MHALTITSHKHAVPINPTADDKSDAADWTPDAHGKCQICKTKFTVVRRRHHCRKCGKLVCGKCAPKDNTKPIPKQGIMQPVRHCKECYRSPACFKNTQRVGSL
eukprot:m.156234 g.156234  ORF g.156234 m.156234 type:complete len:104 (+) comp16436_c0_seq1:40-351(+)